MSDEIRPVKDRGEPVPGMYMCYAGPLDGAAVRITVQRGRVTLEVLPATGTFPAGVQLPLARLEALIEKAKGDGT